MHYPILQMGWFIWYVNSLWSPAVPSAQALHAKRFIDLRVWKLVCCRSGFSVSSIRTLVSRQPFRNSLNCDTSIVCDQRTHWAEFPYDYMAEVIREEKQSHLNVPFSLRGYLSLGVLNMQQKRWRFALVDGKSYYRVYSAKEISTHLYV